jgi:hypothetical protein
MGVKAGMNTKLIFFSILLGLAALNSHATQLDCPGSLKPRLPTLTLNPEVILREGEKHAFGTILKRGEPFPKLKDGPHVFILDQNQNLVLAERFPDFDEVNPVVTHRSLLRMLESSLGTEARLIALGEIHVNHGLITSVNNKAGTAFLPNEYLPEMVEVLRERGLAILPETRIVPFNEVKPGHDSEHLAAGFRNQVERDPQMKALNQKLTEFRARAFERFPSREGAGLVDWRAFLTSPAGPKDHYDLFTIREHQRMFFVAFNWMESMNDRYRTLPRLKELMTGEELEDLIHHLDRFEGALPPF